LQHTVIAKLKKDSKNFLIKSNLLKHKPQKKIRLIGMMEEALLSRELANPAIKFNRDPLPIRRRGRY
jgi:hypothetical protein